MKHFATDRYNVRSSLCNDFNSGDSSDTAISLVDCPECLVRRCTQLSQMLAQCKQRMVEVGVK